LEYSEIGGRIKSRREELSISAADLAARLSMSKATIHRYENGDIAKIKLPVVESMARELNVNPGWLLGKSKVKEREQGESLYMDLQPIVHELVCFLRVAKVRCCGRPMDDKDKRSAISALKLIDDLIVEKYR
jgi:transcriptional regulator with XRE-family HTH domain